MKPIKRQILRDGRKRWEVDFGVVLGHRKRHLVDTEKQADAFLNGYDKDVAKAGEYWARLTESDRLSTTATLIKIREAKQTVMSVWEDWQKWRPENQQRATVPTAYEDAVTEFERRKLAAGKSERYVHNTCDVLKKFGAGRERQPIHKITADDLEAWIAGHKDWSLSSRRTYTLLFSSLWAVAVAKGWCSLNITERLEPIGKIPVEVRIYSNDDVLNILAAAMANESTQAVIAPLALGLFGCMRPEEVESVKALRAGLPEDQLFGWRDIDLTNGRITVRNEIAKTGDQRVVRMQPSAVEWLRLAKELKNPLPPINERRLVDQCCALIGLQDWIRDGLRKCCATNLRAIYKNDYDVCRDMGNSVRVLLKHYAALHVPEEVSMDYWQITPGRVREHIRSDKWRLAVTSASGAQPEP